MKSSAQRFAIISIVLSALSACAASSAYVGQESRAIKALSAQDVRGLLEGQGMGLPRAAELNGYPGPMHVLELARPLALTQAQHTVTQALMSRHKAEARALGAQLVEAERALDSAFAARTIDPVSLERLLGDIGRLQAAVRA